MASTTDRVMKPSQWEQLGLTLRSEKPSRRRGNPRGGGLDAREILPRLAKGEKCLLTSPSIGRSAAKSRPDEEATREGGGLDAREILPRLAKGEKRLLTSPSIGLSHSSDDYGFMNKPKTRTGHFTCYESGHFNLLRTPSVSSFFC